MTRLASRRLLTATGAAVCLGVLALAGLAGCGDGETPLSPTAGATVTSTPDLPPPTPTAGGEPLDSIQLLGELDPDRMMEHARVLSVDIGPRVSGTADELAAVEYISGEFERYGYEVRVEPFEFEGDRYAPAEVRTAEGVLEGFSLIGSAAEEATGPLVFAELGEPEDLAGLTVEGAIVVVDRGVISFGEKYEHAVAAGAAGLIIINNSPGPLVGANLAVRADIPVIGMDLAHRDGLLLAAEAAIEATVRASDSRGSSVNVVARAPEAGCLVIVGGHHDTVPASPGGNDNASGVAHVLELARVTALGEPLPGLCFATFGAEESGLHGSRAMAAELDTSGMLPTSMVNFDVTGMGAAVEAIGTEALVERAVTLGSAANVEVEGSSLPPNAGSDHMSFLERGVPVIFFSTGLYEEIHTPADTFDLLERDAMEKVGIAGLIMVLDLYAEVAPGD